MKLNEELKQEGQCRGIPRCTKAVFSGEGLITYVNNNQNESSNVIF